MKRFAILIILFSLVLSGCQPASNYMLKRNINGVIKEKSIDEQEHYTKYVKVLQSDGSFELIKSVSYKGFWDYSNMGDSIIKKPGTLDLHVIKNGKDSVFKYTGSPWAFKLF